VGAASRRSVNYRALPPRSRETGELSATAHRRGGVMGEFPRQVSGEQPVHKRMPLVSERLAAAEARGVEDPG